MENLFVKERPDTLRRFKRAGMPNMLEYTVVTGLSKEATNKKKKQAISLHTMFKNSNKQPKKALTDCAQKM